jgi:hypothetical protein
MANIIIHPQTAKSLDNFRQRPSHALLLTGANGIGKGTIARLIAVELLDISVDDFATYPYIKLIIPEESRRAIGIEAIRELEHFIALKVPNNSTPAGIARIVVVEDAHLLTAEAQNALLKTLEEPPADTLIILSSISAQMLLPTISSRAPIVDVKLPPVDQTQAYFSQQGYSGKVLDRAVMMSGGLPGLIQAILTGDDAHPLVQAAETARKILQSSTFERLCLVEQLSKQRQQCLDIAFILQQMAQAALRSAAPASSQRWSKIMRAAYSTSQQLSVNAQPKLALTSLMLEL